MKVSRSLVMRLGTKALLTFQGVRTENLQFFCNTSTHLATLPKHPNELKFSEHFQFFAQKLQCS